MDISFFQECYNYLLGTFMASNVGNSSSYSASVEASKLRARISMEQELSPPADQARLDPALLAKLAFEDELRKKGGGGGGGSAPSYNPNMWVSYSFVEIAKMLDELRRAFFEALNQNFQTPLALVQEFVANVSKTLKANLSGIQNLKPMNLLQNLSKNSLNLAVNFGANISNSASAFSNIISAAIANGLKILFGQKEDKDIEEEEDEDQKLSLKSSKSKSESFENSNKG